jgi:hypothetical protein
MPCQRGHQRHLGHVARLEATTMFLSRSSDDGHVPAEQAADEGERRGNALERLYRAKPDEEHMRTVG